MRWMTAVPALALSLLVGCASQVSNDYPAPPNGSGRILSEPRASVQTALSDGPGITALINKNYNEDTTSCTEYGTGKTRGYYFCTGVLLRTTDNENFQPWESSPTALQLRATSYSWIRHDLNTTNFYKRAGLILLNPADVIADAVPGLIYPVFANTRNTPVQCVYPFDAWTTRTMNRNYLGCDFEGTGLGSPIVGNSWGSCDNSLGYSASAQWDSHFRSNGQVNYKQCSWNADNPQGWRNMISSHNSFGGQSSWNEVMLYNWGPQREPTVEESMRRWVVAFFYDYAKPGALADAQAFQQKMANTGKRVPILRIDFNAAASQRFQFLPGDQVAGAYP